MAELNETTFWISGIINGEYRECDGPYTTTKDMTDKGYPYVLKTPNPSFTHQKYDYIAHEWVDTSADALLHEMESIRTDIDGLQQTATTLSQGFASQSQAREAKDKEAEKAMTLLSMVIKQVGAISGKIDGISTKLNEKSATAPAATATQTANETKKAAATAPAGTTTQTADGTKKEGTN